MPPTRCSSLISSSHNPREDIAAAPLHTFPGFQSPPVNHPSSPPSPRQSYQKGFQFDPLYEYALSLFKKISSQPPLPPSLWEFTHNFLHLFLTEGRLRLFLYAAFARSFFSLTPPSSISPGSVPQIFRTGFHSLGLFSISLALSFLSEIEFS